MNENLKTFISQNKHATIFGGSIIFILIFNIVFSIMYEYLYLGNIHLTELVSSIQQCNHLPYFYYKINYNLQQCNHVAWYYLIQISAILTLSCYFFINKKYRQFAVKRIIISICIVSALAYDWLIGKKINMIDLSYLHEGQVMGHFFVSLGLSVILITSYGLIFNVPIEFDGE